MKTSSPLGTSPLGGLTDDGLDAPVLLHGGEGDGVVVGGDEDVVVRLGSSCSLTPVTSTASRGGQARGQDHRVRRARFGALSHPILERGNTVLLLLLLLLLLRHAQGTPLEF